MNDFDLSAILCVSVVHVAVEHIRICIMYINYILLYPLLKKYIQEEKILGILKNGLMISVCLLLPLLPGPETELILIKIVYDRLKVSPSP